MNPPHPRVRSWLPRDWNESLAVVWTALGLIALQVGFRAWALYGSWFYNDDYRLLYDASGARLGWAYLSKPFDSQFMPVGRLVAWGVERSGDLNWALAATISTLLQVVASVACLWMLIVLFGRRWGILVPLSLYLFSVITIPALMWWAASLNQLPLQAVMFVSTATWVGYLRGAGGRYLAITFAVVGLGLLTYVKAILLLPLLGFLALAYFAEGSVTDRLRESARRWWPAVLLLGTLAVGYIAYYSTSVPQPLSSTSRDVTLELADTMLATAFVTAVVGGPWHWATDNPPTSLADPPMWTVHLSWCLALLVILYAAFRRKRTGRAWLLLAGYLLTLLLLVASGRAHLVGSAIGLEYRYLTDAAGVLTLCFGLAFLSLKGSAESSEAREDPLLLVHLGTSGVVALTTVVCIGGVLSSYGHVAIWHDDSPGADFIRRATQDLGEQGQQVHLADRPVPANVMPGYSAPYNFASRLFTLIPAKTSFPETTSRLATVADDGSVHRALIDAGVTARPGRVEGCGWKVTEEGAEIPLTGRVFEWDWWMRIGYLASKDSTVTVTAGTTAVRTRVRTGLNSLYVKNEGGFDRVSIDGLTEGAVVCVDTVEVGEAVPGAGL